MRIVRSNWFLNILGNNSRICLWTSYVGYEGKKGVIVEVKGFCTKQMEEWKYHSERRGKLLGEQTGEEI